jgi:two-component system sensor histidine kinase KdpD
MQTLTNFAQNKIIALLLRFLAVVLTIAAVTLLLQEFKPELANQVIVLIYLLPVMLSTVLWGLVPGILAAFLAFLAFNYYYLVPFYTFQVHATQDLILLIIFLIVAVVLAQLIGQARQGERRARSREWEATRMYELISVLAPLQEIPAVAQALADRTREAFDCTQVEVATLEKKGDPAITARATESAAVDQAPTARIRLDTAREHEGELRLWLAGGNLSPEEQRLLAAFVSQGALSIERIRLARGEKRSRLLEESDKLKSSLLSSVSHELRTPLAAIKASVSSLRSQIVDWNAPERGELLATIEEETDHLNLLVGNLLDMSRIESGALKPHRTWNALNEIVWGVAGKIRTQLQDHRLVINLPGDLPLVPTDYVMIEQVFINLLSNSIKYAAPGTRIEISAGVEDDALHVRLANQSPPVPEDHLARIFEKFHRITEADRVTGTGLGLSICKGIIEGHGGKIWAANEPGRFVFHFTLPLTLDGALPDSPREIDNG